MMQLLCSTKRLTIIVLLLFIGIRVTKIKAFTTQFDLKSVPLRASRGQQQIDVLRGQKRSTSSSEDDIGSDDAERSTNINSSVENGIRLNKVFKATHSRREADDLIASGRVCVNGAPVESKGGFFVVPFRDEITLDGKVVRGWEKMNAIVKDDNSSNSGRNNNNHHHSVGKESNVRTSLSTEQFEYVKYFKPIGVTCTTDLKIKDNIIGAIKRDGLRPRHRVFPVGRLDKETSGLILLTSDGRVVNAVLRGEKKQPKKYKVMVDGRLTEGHLQRLRDGITIRTVAQRTSGKATPLVAKTKPCLVERIGPCSCQMTLVEGRNRQIRKMMSALGFTVVRLHRVEFMGIQLADTTRSKGLEKPGDWAYLDNHEMELVKQALKSATSQ